MAKKRPWGKAAQRVEPEGKARQSQVVTTYGPGAMVDLVEHAAVVGGLDFWRFDDDSKKIFIFEPRLRDAIAERFRDAKRPLHVSKAFVEPPAGNDRDPSQTCGIAALEFPQWFVCQNPACRALVRADGLELKSGRYVHDCDAGSRCVPVRFVGACRHGHLQDFPWAYFIHGMQGKPNCAAPSLRLFEGATGDFAEIRVVCVCGASRPLVHAMVREAGPKCDGKRPWLGSQGNEEDGCGEPMRLLVRTASNSYFAQVVSALSIPEKKNARDTVREVLRHAAKADASNIAVLRQAIPEVDAALQGFTDEEIADAFKAVKENLPTPREPLRTAEFKQFASSKGEATGELPKQKDDFFARTVAPKDGLPKGISKLVLAHKLKEVRVQVGFTRIEPETPDLQGEFDLGVRSSPLGLQTDWLPAAEIHGEGIFIQLDEKAVQQWENKKIVQERGKELLAGYEAWSKNSTNAPPFPGMRFYLIHSLAHLLITALSLECGYAASAIRERLYCAPADDEVPMAAILLSTGSPGTEGTLGGLVEQGRNLRQHLRQAYQLGSLCSNDPVCAAHTPKEDLSERHLEGAACHGCLFIAECSCERYNRYLDRALVVPTIGYEGVAFFSELP